MLVKLLLHEAEEMTLLSRLFKYEAIPLEPNKSKTIHIKPIQINYLDEEESREEKEIDFKLLQIEKEKERIIQEAKEQAKEIILQSQKQAEEQLAAKRIEIERERELLLQEAYQKGFQQGLTEGRDSGKNEFVDLIKQANQVVSLAKEAYEEHLQNSEATILDVALTVAEKIVQTSLLEERERFLPIVKQAIKEAQFQHEIQIHVNPCFYELLISEKQELESLFPKPVQCFIYPNHELPENACLIESEMGRIDASIDTQLSEMKKKLMEIFTGESS